jgi:hypothetical protein
LTRLRKAICAATDDPEVRQWAEALLLFGEQAETPPRPEAERTSPSAGDKKEKKT